MDNPTAKEILSAYRPNGADAGDDRFRDALRQCEHDPDLRAWFAAERSFDERMSAALGQIRAPAAGKQSILATRDFSEGGRGYRPKWWWAGLGLAAAILLVPALLLVRDEVPPPQTLAHSVAALPSLADLAERVAPLDFEGRDTGALLAWLAGHGAPQPTGLPGVLAGATAAGCRVFDFGEAGKVSLLCFELDGHMVHFFIFDERSGPHFVEPRDRWIREGEWNLYPFEDTGRLVALATTADPAQLGRAF